MPLLLRTLGVLSLVAATVAAQKQPFNVQALLQIARISEPQLSPDGKTVAFTVQTIDVAQNTKPKQIYVVPTTGGAPHQITTQGTDNERPQWTPDSSRIVFISDRGGSAQVWAMNADGSQARQVPNLSTEAGGVLVSPDGKKLLFTSNVLTRRDHTRAAILIEEILISGSTIRLPRIIKPQHLEDFVSIPQR